MQICIKCNVEKSLSEFHKSKRSKTGFTNVCSECDCARCRESYKKEERKAVSKKYRQLTSEKNAEYQKQYREENKQRLLEQRRLKVDHKKELDRIYVQNNPAKIVAKSARRRALRLRATPSWASKAYIDIFYQMAKDETERTSREVHVDHIVPLKSELVCGLHSEDNLQLLFKEDNLSKSNVVWPDMW